MSTVIQNVTIKSGYVYCRFEPLGINEPTQPSNENPSVNTSLITNKTYRQFGDGKNWIPGGPHNNCSGQEPNLMGWSADEVGNAPPLFRANWFSQCAVGYHYHSCGAMYFMAYGKMFYHG